MNENEELYRLMNEEDDLYMGDKEDSPKIDNKNSGCVQLFVCLTIIIIILFFFYRL